MALQRQSLSVDLDSLFPEDTLVIGGTTLIIHPLTLEQISIMSKQVKALSVPLTKAGITWENYNTPSNLVTIIEVILQTTPELLAEASNIILDDLAKLPLDVLLQIVDKVIAVNLRSKDLLEKNFMSLTKNFLPEEATLPQKTPNKK